MTAIRPTLSIPATLLVAIGGGLTAGVLTSVLQGRLTGEWNSVANSGAVWTVVAFALACLSVQARWTAVAAGLLALLGEVAGYYAIALPARGVASSLSERVIWTMAALVIGPLVGAAAYYWRRGASGERVVAAFALGGVVVGEGLHNLARDAAGRGVGWVELGVGAVMGTAAVAIVRPSVRAGVGAAALGTVVATAILLAYSEPLLF